MSQKGLQVNPTGILKFVRYLWSLPIVRQAVGWLLQEAISAIVERLKKKRPPKPKPDGRATN